MGTDLHELLRSLRVWDVELPSFDPASAPAEPLPLFTEWFAEAVAAGQSEPHTMSLATADEDGLHRVPFPGAHAVHGDSQQVGELGT
ncbi:hypothetical protein ABZV25_14700, partial [Micrococcus luteus]